MPDATDAARGTRRNTRPPEFDMDQRLLTPIPLVFHSSNVQGGLFIDSFLLTASSARRQCQSTIIGSARRRLPRLRQRRAEEL